MVVDSWSINGHIDEKLTSLRREMKAEMTHKFCVGLTKTNCHSFMPIIAFKYGAQGSRRYLKEFNGLCLQCL